MTENDIDKFHTLVTTTGELYGKDLSDGVVNMYWQCLKKFEFCDVESALFGHANNPEIGRFMPKPADVIKFLEGTGEDKVLAAWTKVQKAVRHVGRYESVAFDDSLIHAVISDMGGWVKLCNTTTNEMPFRCIEFGKRYQEFINNAPQDCPKYLPGISRDEQPVLIG